MLGWLSDHHDLIVPIAGLAAIGIVWGIFLSGPVLLVLTLIAWLAAFCRVFFSKKIFPGIVAIGWLITVFGGCALLTIPAWLVYGIRSILLSMR